MPQGSTRVNKPLTEISVQYNNDEYIAGKVLKDVMVSKESDLYYVYNNDLRLETTNRANGAPANEATYEVSTSSYSLTEHALKDKITKRDRENVDAPLQLDKDTTEYLTDKLMLRQEYEAATLLFTTTSFGNNATLNTATSFVYNTTTSAPIQSVLSATSYILGQGGGKANCAVTSQPVLDALKENDNVFARIQYVERAVLTKELLASLFDLDELFVGSAVYNTAKEGQASSLSNIWGNDFLVANIAKNPRLKTRTAAVTLRQRQYGNPVRVRKWNDDERECDFIEVQSMYAPKLIATSSAYLLKTVALS